MRGTTAAFPVHVTGIVLSLLLLPIIAAAVPVAEFTASPRTGAAPLPVTFSDRSPGSPNGWAWYFGDETYQEPWTQVTPGARWTARYQHTGVVMPDGGIVLIAGFDGDFRCDVWRSADGGTTWLQVKECAGWLPRYGQSSVVMPDGSIVLMGGYNSSGVVYRDVWRSTDKGESWTRMTASAGWLAGYGHSSVVMPEGSIVLMGGYWAGGVQNEVWRSMDNGATWMQVNASAGWPPRYQHTSVVMPDASIVLLGGWGNGWQNDVWRSTDMGATWKQMNASAGWTARHSHASVAMPDGSIVLMGGETASGWQKDVWRSTDNGATWTLVNASAGWTARDSHSGVVLPDGSIVLLGGRDGGGMKNDIFRFFSAGSTSQNPSHTYFTPGTYQASLQVYHSEGYNSTRKAGYITAMKKPLPPASPRI